MMNRFGHAHRSLRNTAAAVLQTEEVVPLRSEADLAAEVARNYRWNFAFNFLDGTFFFFGLSFISASTIGALFVSKLTDSALAIGLLAAIAQAGWYLPQVFTANLVERLPRKKPVVVRIGLFLERLPVWLLVVAALLAASAPGLALVVFFLSSAWRSLGAGVVATAWQDLIARCFPVDHRGRFLGITAFAGTAMGAAGAALSTWLLKAFSFSTNFVYIFAIAAASLTGAWFFLAQTREPVQRVETVRQSNVEFLGKLPDLLRGDRNFRRFLVARWLMTLGNLGTGFVTVSAIYRWQVPDAVVGLYTAVFLIGQMVGNLGSGILADRYGHKLSLEAGALTACLAFGLAWLAPSPEWIYAVFFLMGVNLGTILVSGILVAMEFSEPHRRPTYVGLANTSVGVVGLVAPLVGAWLAAMSYGWLFAAGAALNLCALVAMRWWVREPRWAKAGRD
jgi:MFS family permease